MKTLKNYEIHQLCASLGIALKSGMSIQNALDCMYDLTSKQLKVVIETTKQKLQEADTLSEAWKKTGAFPDYAIYLTEVGERCGCLDQVMQALSIYYKRNAELEEQLHHALLYPFLLLILMFTVMGILIWKVLPIFQDVLHSLGTELSAFALQLMNAGSVLAFLGFSTLMIILLLILCFYLAQQKGSKDGVIHFIAKFPLSKSLYYELSMAQLTYILALFISSGLQIEETLPSMIQVIRHPNIKQKLLKIKNGLEAQQSLIVTIRHVSLYRGMELGMLEIGFQNGVQDEVMKQLSDTYEQRINGQISEILNVIEPAVLTILSVFVGMILLSVMLPLMSIMSSL